MRVFITGGAGYVGSHIAKNLAAHGFKVTVLSRNPEVARLSVDSDSVRIVNGDLLSPKTYEDSLNGQDALIHNAVIWNEEEDVLELEDTRASLKLYQAAAKVGVKHFIYTSSTAVNRPFLSVMDESSPLRPPDSYGATKASTELFLNSLSYQFEMKFNIIRLGPVVGAPAQSGGSFKIDRRFFEVLDAVRNKQDVAVTRGAARQFIGAADAARAFRTLLYKDFNRETFLCVSKDMTTWHKIAEQIVRSASASLKVVDIGSSEEVCRFDVSKMLSMLGLEFNSDEHMRQHIACLSNHFI